MKRLKNTSISKKLTLLVLAAVSVALALSCAAFVFNDIRFMRDAMVRQLTALADVLASNTTAALTFDDSDSARQILNSLQLQRSVELACVYDANGKAFATYYVAGHEHDPPPAPPAPGYEFTADGHLDVSAEIAAAGERLGMLYLHASLDQIYRQLLNYAAIVLAVLAASFAASYLIAWPLRRAISAPILALAKTAQQVSANQDYSLRVTRRSNDELGVLYDQFNRMLEQVEVSRRDLEDAHNELEHRVEERTRELSEANCELSKEIAERRRAEAELEQVHRDFVDAARRAGMAEIASGVLHNVGNVLNSVNVSTTLLASQIKSSKRPQLDRVVALLEKRRDQLAEYLTADEKGRQIPALLKLLAEQLRTEEESLLEEVESLVSNVDHIKAIVSTQQSYAGMSGLTEPIDVNALLDDAVKMNSSSFERHRILVERDFATLPMVVVDKQRLLQIVINLIKNAKEALVEQQECARVLTLRTSVAGGRLLITVKDTGIGIEPSDLTRIFTHGYTTKASGHGFGLHSCANSAAEMDGSLTAHSEGCMRGASFTLNLPFTPVTALA